MIGRVVMGLDVSVTGTGIALVNLPVIPVGLGMPIVGNDLLGYYACDRVGYGLTEDASFDDRMKRMDAILSRIAHVLEVGDPNLVAIEDVVFASEGSAKAQIWGMNTLVQYHVWCRNVPVAMVALDSWRAFFGVAWNTMRKHHPGVTGSKRSRLLKDKVREAIAQKYGPEFSAKNHNEAEAYAIAKFAFARSTEPKTGSLFT